MTSANLLPGDPVQTIVVPRTSDLGDGFEVRRALPSAQRRMVGPFVFLDHMGPVRFEAGRGLDVRPHPHIGLATVTYLHEGAIVHRDSLGSVQAIHPGDVNWMTAGRGIVHSERTGPQARSAGARLAGLQMWVGLPRALEEAQPAFAHHPGYTLPEQEGEGVRARIIAGSLFGKTSPVATLSDLFFADATLRPGARLVVPAEHEERAVYLIDGPVDIGGQRFEPGRLLVLAPGRAVEVAAPQGARLALLGGEPLDGPRYVWWNFVSGSRERIEQAKQDWQRDRFGVAVPGETEFIPLPEPRS
mgnify:CR=1 FL=1